MELTDGKGRALTISTPGKRVSSRAPASMLPDKAGGSLDKTLKKAKGMGGADTEPTVTVEVGQTIREFNGTKMGGRSQIIPLVKRGV